MEVNDTARDLDSSKPRHSAENDRGGRAVRVRRAQTHRFNHKVPRCFAFGLVEDGARCRHCRTVRRAVDIAVGDDGVGNAAVADDADAATTSTVRAAAANGNDPGQQTAGAGDRATGQGEPDPTARGAVIAAGTDLAVQNDVCRCYTDQAGDDCVRNAAVADGNLIY